MNLKEKKVNSSTVYDGKIIKVEVDEVELPDGRHSKRECVRHSGGAAVLFVKGDEIALVRQFRYLYGEETYEIPAGKLNDGEDAQQAALRELEEETGYRAISSRHLLGIYPTPGYTDEIIHIYFVGDDMTSYHGASFEKFFQTEQEMQDYCDKLVAECDKRNIQIKNIEEI